MCCNADILFCVLVLHWVSSKEQKAEDSAFRSGTGRIAGAGTVGSNRDRSRRDVVEAEKHSTSSSHGAKTATTTTISHVTTPPATITTQCKSGSAPTPSGIIRVLHRRGSSWDGSKGKPGVREDEVELNNIRVQTVYTREVEVEGESKRGASASSDGGDEWVGSRKGVVGERIV